MNGDYETMFWLLVFTAIVSLLGILSGALGLRNLLKSDAFIEQLKKKKNSDLIKTIMLLLTTTLPGLLYSQAEGTTSTDLFDIGYEEVMMMAVINVVLIGVILFIRKLIKDMLEIIRPAEEKVVEPEVEIISKISHALTDWVPMEEEHTILMDHDYDGIQELDNNLPPWWKWGFYLSIFIAVVYLLNYHVLGISDLQIEAYHKDVAQAELDVTAYLESMALNVDETSVVMLKDAAALANGKNIYIKNCAVCHLDDGGGQVGPNFTDDHWIYGPDIKTMFSIVKYGAKNGMTSWKEKLTPVEMQEVSSYIRTLHGTVPAIAKEPQGTFMEFIEEDTEQATDSSAVAEI